MAWNGLPLRRPESIHEWRQTPQYREWQRAVKQRDDYTCQICGSTLDDGSDLHAHHIYPGATYPQLRFDVTNGITLCSDCHAAIHAGMTIEHEPEHRPRRRHQPRLGYPPGKYSIG